MTAPTRPSLPAVTTEHPDYEARELRWLSRGGDPRRAVWALRFVWDGAALLSASDDGVVRRWRCDDGAIDGVYEGCAAPVALDVTPDERAIVCAGAGGEVLRWALAGAEVEHRGALDLSGSLWLPPRRREGISTCDAVTVRCAPDGEGAWVHADGRAWLLDLTGEGAVTRRMRDVIAVGCHTGDGVCERLWLDPRGVHRSPRKAATHTLTGVAGHALRSECRSTPAMFSPRGERLVLSPRLRVALDARSLTRAPADATEACRADECTALALADGLELWATGWRNDASRALGALSLRVGDGVRGRLVTGVDLAEPERVTAMALTDRGRVAVATNLGAIFVCDVDRAGP